MSHPGCRGCAHVLDEQLNCGPLREGHPDYSKAADAWLWHGSTTVLADGDVVAPTPCPAFTPKETK